MTSVPISYGATKRSLSPEAVLLNCFVEKAPTQQGNPFAIRARPGLTSLKTVGTAPIRGIFARAGLFDNRALVLDVSGVYLIDDTGAITALSGTVGGSGRVDIDAGVDSDINSIARIATGEGLYLVSGSTVTKETTFPGAGCSSICYHRGFWLGIEVDSQQVFYQVPGDTAWDALSFASAEYSPDPLVAVRSRGDQIALLGSETTEIWALTGQASPAIQPYGGLNFDYGCRSRDSAVNVGGTLIWVDHLGTVRMFDGGQPSIISDNGLVEQIRQADAGDLRACGHIKDQHPVYQLTIGTVSTWCYDLSTQEPHRRATQGRDYLSGHLCANIGDNVYVADTFTNQISLLDPSVKLDGSAEFAVTFTGFVELLEGQIPCVNVELICATGAAPLSGQGSSPLIQMRYSDDAGNTFGPWKEASMGATGKYLTRVRWNNLGNIKAPYGRIFQFNCSDPIGRRFSSLQMNVI